MVRQKIIYGKKRYLAVGIFLFTLLGKYVLMETCLVVSQKSTKDGHPEPKVNSKNYCFFLNFKPPMGLGHSDDLRDLRD